MHYPVRKLLAGLVFCAASSWSQTIISATAGDSTTAYNDHPDPAFCVGFNHLIEFNGANVVVRNKGDLSVVSTTAQVAWWQTNVTKVGGGSWTVTSTLHDPRCHFDPLSQRWFMANNDGNASGTGTGLWVAVSSGSDPTTSTWKGFGINASSTPAIPNTIDMMPRVTVDKYGLWISGANAGGSAPNTDQLVVVFPIADMLLSTPDTSHGTVFTGFHHEGIIVKDANASKALSDYTVLVARNGVAQNAGACATAYQYAIRRFNWSNSTTPVLVDATDKIVDPSQAFCPTITTGLAQLSGGANNIKSSESHRPADSYATPDSTAFWVVGGQANTATTNGLYWAKISVNGASPALVQAGTVDGSGATPQWSAIHGAGVLDQYGNYGIVATRLSTAEYPSTYIWEHLAGDSTGTLRAPVLATAGTNAYVSSNNPAGWGVYASTAVDPMDGTLWAYNQVALSATSGQWATSITHFAMQPATHVLGGKSSVVGSGRIL